ncbi:cytochrome P450 [Amycolatopsis rubida]|uniref:Cytochrome P450 n=1 Tax=Amycolatopsis rubida TaxID=112413 RepID=A0ABX0BX38_9PSEU|nr:MULTISPECIES: cytochrome P450 [Amycolatopsis]MYW94969.1 cytochrome P450 [Amycolatopsis rubida]NEC59956.1 cytochrome P450 [Amycolatopsis rubida]OAP19944.1 Vitamin D(3) 25-hydroxylase [Amycolatopsis sp. M39]
MPRDTRPAAPGPFTLDPTAADHFGEAARMRAAGPVVRVVLPGDVPAWLIIRHDAVAELLAHREVSKDWRNWAALADGTVPADWPLLGMFKVDNMVYADGDDHLRLRRPVVKVFTPARVAAMGSGIENIVDGLLDHLPRKADADCVVDLRAHFAEQVPLTVICDLVGVPHDWRPLLAGLVQRLFDTTLTAGEAAHIQHARYHLLRDLVLLRRTEPADDITTALIALCDNDTNASTDEKNTQAEDAKTLSAEELVDTLWLLLTAGYETTASLLANASLALLAHPGQLRAARDGGPDMWPRVVEESLRRNAPVGNFPARYPLTDITIAGTAIPAGDLVLAGYSSAGRDTDRHGPDADAFDIHRSAAKHLAFGGGPHLCLGAHLARLQATVALPALFSRYPRLALAAEPGSLPPLKSLFANSAARVPVRLGAPARRTSEP